MKVFIRVFIFVVALQGVCKGQHLSETYSRVVLPTEQPISVAAVSDKVVVTDAGGKTFVSPDLVEWREVATDSPTMLWAFQEKVWGVKSNAVVELNGSGQWLARTTITNLYLVREFGGILYGLASYPATFSRQGTVVLRSEDGVGWTELSRIAGVTHAYDIVVAEGRFLISNIRGEYYVSEDGAAWVQRNIGVSDRLYSAIHVEDHFILGGIGSLYLSDDLLEWERVEPGISTARRLFHAKGFTFAAGGYNPDQGAIAVSSDLNQWKRISGEPIPSVVEVTVFRDNLLFLSSSSQRGVLSSLRYYPPAGSNISLTGNVATLRTESRFGFIYQLQGSADLGSWEDITAPTIGNGSSLEWRQSRLGSDHRFYRWEVK